MSAKDLKINSKVRKILTEYSLDLTTLNVSSSSGTVSIRGELKKITSRELSDRDIALLMAALERVILMTKDVKRVSFSLKGWKKTKGKWARG